MTKARKRKKRLKGKELVEAFDKFLLKKDGDFKDLWRDCGYVSKDGFITKRETLAFTKELSEARREIEEAQNKDPNDLIQEEINKPISQKLNRDKHLQIEDKCALYLMKDVGSGDSKIGISNDLTRRVREVQDSYNVSTVELIDKTWFLNRSEAECF